MPTSDDLPTNASDRLRQVLQGSSRPTQKPMIQVGPPDKEVFVQLALEGTLDGLIAIEILGYDGKPLVQVHGDGTIQYGESYDPDAAAEIFWAAIAKHFSRKISVADKEV